MTSPWRAETVTGPAAHLLEPPQTGERLIRVLVPEDRAVVLGSTQPESHVEVARAATAGITVLRRRSGGGAVLVGPDQILWTDVVIPVGDPLWTVDVDRAFWWLGGVWIGALSAVGIDDGLVWRGGLIRNRWSDRICFAGLGAGEVTVAGAKVVGIAQRRTRTSAHFQCAVPIVWNPSELLDVMALDSEARAGAEAELAGVALAVGVEVASRLLPAFVDRLP